MSSSTRKIPQTRTLASSRSQPPFSSLRERNAARRQRKLFAQYHPLEGLGGIPVPGTLHWAVQVVSTSELANDDPGYIWELVQDKQKVSINVSSWLGATAKQKHFLGYTNMTDKEICSQANTILNDLNTNNFGLLDAATRLYMRPLGLAHSLRNKSPSEVRAYDILVRNCQDFAQRLKDAVTCSEEGEDSSNDDDDYKANQQTSTYKQAKKLKKRRGLRKKTGAFFKVMFSGTGRGFKKLGTEFWKIALLSSVSNPQFIQPMPR